jgi:hypothetical protein
MSKGLVDPNGQPIGNDAHVGMSPLEESLLSDAKEEAPPMEGAPKTEEIPGGAMPELSISPDDSFILFRPDGQYVMHLGPNNRVTLNTGGFLVSFCCWVMNQATAIDEFKEYLAECMNNPQVVDSVVEKVSNEVDDSQKS